MRSDIVTREVSEALAQRKGDTACFWLVLGVGAILRLATLGRQSLWLDEGFSYWIANRSWTALLESLPSNDSHPPLHYLILQPMIALGGDEWLLRLPSALADIAGIGLLFAIGMELFDRRTALVAAIILAISPLHIWYAQEARMYALVAVLSLAAGLFAARALRTNLRLDWLTFGLCEGLALLADIAAVWFVLAVNVAWLMEIRKHRRTQRLWPWLTAQLLALLLYLPWLPGFLIQLSGNNADWVPRATFTILARTVTDFIGGYEHRSTLESAMSAVVLAAPPVVAARRLASDAATRRRPYLLLVLWFCIPIGLPFLISQPYVRVPLLSGVLGHDQSVFLTRSLIVAGFPLYLLLARSLVLSRRSLLPLMLVALTAMSGASYYQNVLLDSKEDYRTAAQIVRSQAMPNDVIMLVPPYIKLPFFYYYDRSSAEMSLDSVTNGVISDHAIPTSGSPAELLTGYRRAWLIANPDNVYREDDSNMRSVLETEGTLLDSQQLCGVSVNLYRIGEAK